MVSISTSQEYVIQGSVHEAIGLKASIHIGLICFLNHSINNQYNISNCCQFGFWDGGDNFLVHKKCKNQYKGGKYDGLSSSSL